LGAFSESEGTIDGRHLPPVRANTKLDSWTMKALLTGATGFIGRELLRHIEAPVVLCRDPTEAHRKLGGVEAHRWDPELGPPPIHALGGIDVVYHLAGEPVAPGRWTAEKKHRIRDSRVVGTRHLVAGLAEFESRPRVLVTASAVGYCGDRGEEELDETSAAGAGFLAQVCVDWEREALVARELGIRVVCLRMGMVLAPGGGALKEMLTPFKLGLGGPLGNGQHWMPWVHREDAVGLLLHASRAEIRGAMNGVSPGLVRNADFARALGRALHRPALLPVPSPMLRVALGEVSEMLVASARVLPRVAERTGYVFRYLQPDDALRTAVAPRARQGQEDRA
jgi:uncharacterized protein